MTDDPKSDRSTRRLRPGRWLLLTSLVALIAVAIVVGLRIRSHRALVARLAYHHAQLEIEPFGPSWLSSVVPREWREAFGRVRGVRFEDSYLRSAFTLSNPIALTDDALIAAIDDLSRLPSLVSVSILYAPKLGDRGVRALQQLKGLEVLEIDYCPITDAAFLGASAEWPVLREVSLRYTKVGDGTARELAGLPNLESVHLDGTAVGDDGAGALADSPSLESLSLSNTYVTDVGINALVSRIPDLEVTDD